MRANRTIRCGVIGYGGAFNMGHRHLTSMKLNPGMEAAAVCEIDAAQPQVAQGEWLGKSGLVITPESAARVIGVLEAANLSAGRGSAPVKPAFP